MNESFSFAIQAGIGIFTLNKPPQNALDHRFFGEFKLFSETALTNSGLRGLLVHGAGKHFSAGADTAELGRLLRGRADQPDFLADNALAFANLEMAPFPVVAAISGCCLGAGLELALACHYRIAAPNVILAFPESGFGLIPGCGGTVRSTQCLRIGSAIDLILTGRNVLGEEAARLGLIDGMVSRDKLVAASLALINHLAAVPLISG